MVRAYRVLRSTWLKVMCGVTVSDVEGKAAAKAVKQLGGMRLCASGAEEHVTHLVMGSPRRTLKVSCLQASRHAIASQI